MDQLIQQASIFIQTHQQWAGVMVGLLALGESLLVIGILIPASVLMLLVGGLVGHGVLNPLPIIAWGAVGAIVGDALSYYLGRLLGPTILRRWPLSKQRRAVARARYFFYKHGMLSIFAGRFMGPLRAVVPTVAGVLKMSHWRFQIANVLSAFIWIPVMLIPGYVAGRSLDAANTGSHSGVLAGVALSVILAVWITARIMRKRRRRRPTIATQPHFARDVEPENAVQKADR